MKMLKTVAITPAAAASVGLSLDTTTAGTGSFGEPCGGFKSEIRTMCWRNLL